jgi:hypothetical protein
VPADRIAESLAFINWTVLTALGVGAFGAVVAGRFLTEATKGYLGFTAFSAAIFAALAWAADTGLPPASAADELLVLGETARRAGLAALAVFALLYAVQLWRGGKAGALAGLGLAAAAIAFVTAAVSWASSGSTLGSVLLFVQFVALSASLGGVWAAMLLGHWYLVTPRLPEAPLVRFARWLTIALALQLALFVAWLAFGAGPAGTPGFAALFGPAALFVWLRLLVGLIFPLIVSWAAIQTARSRSMESATGLLYINVGTIAAGTILAAGLYFGAGLLV